MAESLFDKQDDEAPGEEQVPLDPTAGIATTLALNRAKRRRPAAKDNGKEQDQAATALLHEQRRILQLQGEHLHEQRALQLSHLRARRISEWLKVALQVLAGCLGFAIVGVIATMCLAAASSRMVVVEAFDVPPALAATGQTGKVLAGGVLDALTRIQDVTRSDAAKRKLASAWEGDIRVEVPETGMSAGELIRLLHQILGRDVHIRGDLVELPGGKVALTVRGDDILPHTFTGPADQTAALTTQAAEYVYGQAEPFLYAAYLGFANRSPDALAFLAKAYPGAPARERPDMLNEWGNQLYALDRAVEAADKYRRAVELRPRFWKAWANLILILQRSDGAEAALRAGRQMLTTAANGPASARPTPGLMRGYDSLRQDFTAAHDDLLWDMKTYGDRGAASTLDAAELAMVEYERHDWPAALKLLDQSDPDDLSTQVTRALLFASHALAGGDARTAADVLRPMQARWTAEPAVRAYYPGVPCLLASADYAAGDRTEGERLFALGGHWLPCQVLHAAALDRAGDWDGARRGYLEAIADAPDAALAHARYGEALLARRQTASAIAELARANALTPHYADPLKAWGDALAGLGRRKEALAKYAEALKWAPNWPELRAAYRAAARGR